MQQDQEEQFIIIPELTPEEYQKLQKQHLQKITNFYGNTKHYQMDYWYHAIYKYTFRSQKLQISAYQGYLLNRLYYNQSLTEVEVQSLFSLENKVNIFINNYFPNGCFMKLSTRSPKDYSWDYRDKNQAERLTKELTKSLQKFLEKNNIKKQTLTKIPLELLNQTYKQILKNSRQKLKIHNGKDFIRIFSKSQRVVTDVYELSVIRNRIFNQFQKGQFNRINQHLIDIWGREWIDSQWYQQIRCFYYNYKLNCISQYDQRCYFEEYEGKESKIIELASQIFQKIKPELQKINLDKGVLDLVMKQLNDVKCGEINIFQSCTRGSLFNWDNQTDLNIMKNGPLQLRILKQSKVQKVHIDSMMGMIEKGLAAILEQVFINIGLGQLYKKQ